MLEKRKSIEMLKNKTAFLITGIIILLAAIVSGGGLLMKNLYHDNAFVKMAWHTNDIITLFVVVPLMTIAMFLAYNGNVRWLFLLLGLLGYIFYNFAFYLFGASFNAFFLIYSSLLFLSACTIILFLSQSSLSQIAASFSSKTPVKWISMYLVLIAFLLFSVELSMIVPFLTSNIVPETIKLTGNATSIVFALDFSIVIPVSLIAAILLWRRSSWGFVLSIIMLVKGFTYGIVLCFGTISLAYSAIYGKWDPLMPLYMALVVGGLLCCWLLLKNLNPINE